MPVDRIWRIAAAAGVCLAGVWLAAGSAMAAAGGVACFLSTTPLVFGHYVPSAATPLDFRATISLTCSASDATARQVNGTISIVGGGAGHNMTSRRGVLRYQLFRDPAHSLAWGDRGDGVAVSGVVTPALPLRQTIQVYGRLLARQSAAPVGTYKDQIAVLLDY